MYSNNYSELYHYGVPGMKRGQRRWTNPDGTLNAAGKERYKNEGASSNYNQMKTQRRLAEINRQKILKSRQNAQVEARQRYQSGLSSQNAQARNQMRISTTNRSYTNATPDRVRKHVEIKQNLTRPIKEFEKNARTQSDSQRAQASQYSGKAKRNIGASSQNSQAQNYMNNTSARERKRISSNSQSSQAVRERKRVSNDAVNYRKSQQRDNAMAYQSERRRLNSSSASQNAQANAQRNTSAQRRINESIRARQQRANEKEQIYRRDQQIREHAEEQRRLRQGYAESTDELNRSRARKRRNHLR